MADSEENIRIFISDDDDPDSAKCSTWAAGGSPEKPGPGGEPLQRFEKLLQKTENISHLLTTGRIDTKKKPVVQKNSAEGDHRHRMTEKEEDEELLQQTKQFESLMTFNKSPYHIKNGEMRDYQIRGLNWLIQLQQKNINGILADEMGLGKTLQTISVLGYMKHFKHMNGPFLIIVPKSTLNNWMKELKKWCATISAYCLIGDQKARNQLINENILPGNFEYLKSTLSTFDVTPIIDRTLLCRSRTL